MGPALYEAGAYQQNEVSTEGHEVQAVPRDFGRHFIANVFDAVASKQIDIDAHANQPNKAKIIRPSAEILHHQWSTLLDSSKKTR